MTSLASARPWAGIALAAAATDLAALALLHVLQPSVPVLTEPTSAYVHGTAGFLAPVTALAAGVGALALALALWVLPRSPRTLVGRGLLAAFGAVKVAQAFFPLDDAVATTAGTVHDVLGNLAFLLLPAAIVVLTAPLVRLVAPDAARRVALVVVPLAVLLTLAVPAADGLGAFGLAQRAYLVAMAVWVGGAAWSLLRARPTP